MESTNLIEELIEYSFRTAEAEKMIDIIRRLIQRETADGGTYMNVKPIMDVLGLEAKHGD